MATKKTQNIIKKTKRFSIGEDDYVIIRVNQKGKSPHAYFVQRNGLWFTRGWKTKKGLLTAIPKLRGKFLKF